MFQSVILAACMRQVFMIFSPFVTQQIEYVLKNPLSRSIAVVSAVIELNADRDILWRPFKPRPKQYRIFGIICHRDSTDKIIQCLLILRHGRVTSVVFI